MKGDLERLQGVWNIAALEVDGNKMPGAIFGDAKVIVRRDQFESLGMGTIYRGKVSLDATKRPKQFDMRFMEGPEKGNTNYGIYELDGDTWKLCLDTTGKSRPKSFATQPGSGHAMETFQRAPAQARSVVRNQAAKARKAAKGGGAARKSSAAVTEFEGEWAMVSGVFDGATMDKSMVQWVKRITRGGETTAVAGPQTMLRVEFTYDPTKSPKTIDYVNLHGANKGKSQQGIYEFDGDALKMCVAAPGKPRPAEFASKPGDGRAFTVWKRV